MNKPELLVTPKSYEHMKTLCENGADAFVVGEEKFALRVPASFSKEEIKELNELAKSYNKKLYVAVNGIYHNDKIDDLTAYITYLGTINIDAIIFGDPAILMIRNEVAPHLPIHWSTETTGTNWFTCNYWADRGAKRAVLAKEISLDAVVDIKEHAKPEIEVQVQGMMAMFHSKRELVQNYYLYQKKNPSEEKTAYDDRLYLLDRERGVNYPIYEDNQGTHIMSPKDVVMIHELDELIDAEVDSFKFDGILQDEHYITEVTKLYRQAIDMCVEDREQYEEEREQFLEKVLALQPTERPTDTGFFYKETVY